MPHGKDNKTRVSILQTSCHNCSLSSLCLPKDLIATEIVDLENIIKQLPPISKHGHIYNQGDTFSSLYVVRNGYVKKYQTDSDGNEQVVGFSLPGEILGLEGMGTGEYMNSAVTLDTTSFCQLDYDKFATLCENIPGLTKHILKLAGHDLIAEQEIHRAISQKKTDERVAVFFTSLSTRLGLLGYSIYEFNLPMGRHDIANFLGMRPETFTRSLRTLIDEGMLNVDRKNIKIKNLDGLRTLAGHCDTCPSLVANG